MKIYVSTRPHLRQELEKKLKVKALSLTSFTKDNQLEFLKKYWKKHLNLKTIAQLKKCEVYARHLISKIFEWINDEEKTALIEIPLQTRMLAEVFQERSNLNGEELGEWEGCHEFSTSGGEEPKLPRKINLVKLYQMFMSKKRYIFVYDKSRLTGNVITSDAVNQAYEECKAFHQLLAMELLLGENAHMMTTYKTLREKNPDEKNAVKMGIVEKVGDCYSFMHRTFAEFYVAECLFFELNLKDQNAAFQNLFTDIILAGSQFIMIRSFLDGFLQDALPEETVISFSSLDYDRKLYHTDLDCTFMHTLVEEGHMNLIHFFFKCFGLMEKRVEIDRIRDDNDKTLLHYAARGHPQIVRLLVDQGADVNSEDCYSNMPLLVAVSVGQSEIASFLLERGVNVNYFNVHRHYGYTALILAAKMGNHEVMELLLKHGADVNIMDVDGRTALHDACYVGYLDSVRLLVSNGADVRSKTDDDSTPLHVACQEASKDVVEFLVDNGADVNEADNDGRTPLHVVAEFGDVELFQYLEQNGADAQARDEDGCSPLHYAICSDDDGLAVLAYLLETHDANLVDRSGNAALHKAVQMGYLNVIKLLVSRGADVNLKNTRGRTAFHEATWRSRLDIFQYLIEKGAEINVKDAAGRTALHNEGLYLELAEFLVDHGVDVNEADNRGRTPLHIAAACGDVELFKYLEQNGADAQARDVSGSSPLHYATYNGNLEIVGYILETNDVDQVDRNGNAALHLAVENGYLDVVKFLVSRDADVNLENSRGRTALHKAALLRSQDIIHDVDQNWAEANSTDDEDPTPFDNERLHLELVELLVDAGADLRLRDKHGRTSLDYAIVRDHTQLVQYFISKGPDANVLDKFGRRPIHEAMEMGHFTVLELLVDAKCDVNAKDDRGRTALHVASRGSLDLVKFLVDNGAVVDVEDDEGCTPLQDCVATGELAVIEFLIGKGANVNTRNAEGCTPLLSAALEGNQDGIRLLVENGADVNARDNAGRTPFIVAVRCGHLVTVKLMVERGANIHATDEGGSTGLHAAARWNFVDIVRFLVDSGADVDAADGNGRTALHVAARPKYLEVVKLLVKRGAHVNATDHKDRTPLHATAARRCRDEGEYASLLEVMGFLVQSGTEVDARDIDGRTAMDFAAESGRTDKVALLVTLGGDIGVRDNSNTIPSEYAAGGRSSDVVRFFEARKT
ncbi:hypothetical protein NQ318_000072 [Aromia moschata]|uniref:Ankyrin repeat protein n=1 Tax=Aromia moschata TaxID=1265417 RepID=A0AAV8YCK2_9CUCU|nr:hypothetical protein NQ318_000072 [Aromia moschata]